ncbi:MAG: PAS domain S-box protein [Dehalococcoidales bacterium]
MNTRAVANAQKEVSCRVTNSVLKYLESKGYNCASIIKGLPYSYSKEYLSDPHNWVTYEARELLCRRAAELTNDDTMMFQVGLSTPLLNPLGGIESMIRLLTGPKMVYKLVPNYAALFDRVFKFKTYITGANKATVKMTMEGNDYSPSKDSCYYAQGILAAIPTVWNLPPSIIREMKCMCKAELDKIQDGVQYEAEACEFEVQWQPLHSWYKRLRDNLFSWFSPLAIETKVLEESYRQVDQKNAELVARNKQLAAVREIALSVDKVRTIDETLSMAVELSREIEGIQFVLVQKLDEAKEFVITPYYSKIRSQFRYMANAIKALGFDIEKELGKNPTSNKLHFRFSKLKAAQDYVRNPRVMVMNSLADLLDGVWPRTLCNAIQKIMGVKKLVIIPIMVEGESWGNLLFFLNKEVPVDILEMIGAHCAIAVKNIDYIEALAGEAIRRRILIEQSSDGIVILDYDGGVYEANQRFADMLGYSIEEVRKLHVFDWESVYPRQQVVDMLRTIDEKGDHIETKHRRKDGTVFDVEISTNGAIFAGQKLVFCVCRDITERKQMVEALRESEERYRTIFKSANDILILFDNKGRIVDINTKIEDIAGYTREEVVGQDFRLLYKMMPKKSLAILAKNFLKMMIGKDVPFFDVEMTTKGGEPRTIQINAVAVRKDKKIIGGLAILRDISEARQAEKNLKLQKDLIDRILATIPNAVLLLNKNLNVIMANQSFYTLFKHKKKEVERKFIKSLIAAADLDREFKKMLNGKESKTSAEFRYNIGSSEKLLLISIFAMKEEYILLVINDVTEERAKQERLYLTDRLVSVGEMASGVAHELNNPLTSVIGLSSLLLEQDMPDTVKEDMKSIYSEAQRCASIVKNLLTFARKHVSKREPIKIPGVMADVLKLRRYEHQVNNITVKTDLPPDLPAVLADYFEIQQVFINIVLNAESAMIEANGHGTLKISGKVIDKHVNVSFTDDGPGISKENMRSIFNPFFTTKQVGKGTGLGLSICYGIVTSHGGKIYAESDYGKGATFVVELPVLNGSGKKDA